MQWVRFHFLSAEGIAELLVEPIVMFFRYRYLVNPPISAFGTSHLDINMMKVDFASIKTPDSRHEKITSRSIVLAFGGE